MFQPGGKIPLCLKSGKAFSYDCSSTLRLAPHPFIFPSPLSTVHSVCVASCRPFKQAKCHKISWRKMCEMFCQHNYVACHLIRHNKMEQNARVRAVTSEGRSREWRQRAFWEENRQLIWLHNGNQAAWIDRKEGSSEVKCQPSWQAALRGLS